MDIKTFNGVDYYLPEKTEDIQLLITQARQNGQEVRVRGSYHSVPVSITADAASPSGKSCINMMLSHLNKVDIDSNAKTVTVEAGCHLGYDPFDPTKISTWENSLFKQLNDAKFAAPDMGGIIHQTVGGFLSTGSSGGSTTYAFNESLLSITFIPADTDNPQPVTASITDANTDLFYAIGVSMGLLGIIISATFSIIPQYCIQGTETITTIADCAVDLTGKGVAGKKSLRDFLLTTEYTRILWYPQPTVSKATVWQAARIPYTTENIVPYLELPKVMGSFIPLQLAADVVYTAIGQWPNWLQDVLPQDDPRYKKVTDFVNANFYPLILPILLSAFVTLDKKDANGNPIPQSFLDYWWSSLPMDNNISDKLFPVEFTELWIPFEAEGAVDTVAEVMKTLNTEVYGKMYANNSGPIPAGAFNTELYAAKNSKFWMSPANGVNNVFRVDVFWFGNNLGSPATEFYPLFWEALKRYNFRCHWGKYMPDGTSAEGVDYLKKQYPMWDKFLALREQLDPKQIFVNQYWRNRLGITPA